MDLLIAWLTRAIMFGTVIMFGSMGEIITEKSGNLNLGVPGIMYLGGFAGFVSAFYYENLVANPNPIICIAISMLCAFAFAMLGGLIYAFLTITLRANQNVTGLALTIFGTGFANVFGSFLMKDQVYAAALYANGVYNCIAISMLCAFAFAMLGGLIYAFLTITLRANQNVTGLALTIFGTGFANVFGSFLMKDQVYAAALYANGVYNYKIFGFIPGAIGQVIGSHGFMVYLAIIVAVVISLVINRTKVGLSLRAVGENPGTADAAGINVIKYKYLATCIGAGISGLGGLYYALDYNNGIWSTTSEIESLGWLAVALVIFTTWKSLNAIWGSYLFGLLFWLYQFLPGMLGIVMPSYATKLVQMLPYLVTVVVLIITSLRKKREQQPPASLGLSYFREER